MIKGTTDGTGNILDIRYNTDALENIVRETLELEDQYDWQDWRDRQDRPWPYCAWEEEPEMATAISEWGWGYDWIQYLDDYPNGAETWAYIGSDIVPPVRENPQNRTPNQLYHEFQELEAADNITGDIHKPKEFTIHGKVKSLVYHCSKWDADGQKPENTDIQYFHVWKKNHCYLAEDEKGNMHIIGKVLITEHGIEDYEGLPDWDIDDDVIDYESPKKMAFLGILKEITLRNGKVKPFYQHVLAATDENLYIVKCKPNTIAKIRENYNLS